MQDMLLFIARGYLITSNLEGLEMREVSKR